MTLDDLLRIMPAATAKAGDYLGPLCAAMDEFSIDTPPRKAAFLAQVGHESRQLATLEENLNYRPQALLDTFNTPSVTRFTPEQAERYGRTDEHPADQRMIANIAYANRGGNGGVESGDGWNFRGAGLIQLTFRGSHEACADHFGIAREEFGAWVRTPEGASRSAARYWQGKGLNALADAGDFVRITIRINGALRGQAGRIALWDSAREALGVA